MNPAITAPDLHALRHQLVQAVAAVDRVLGGPDPTDPPPATTVAPAHPSPSTAVDTAVLAHLADQLGSPGACGAAVAFADALPGRCTEIERCWYAVDHQGMLRATSDLRTSSAMFGMTAVRDWTQHALTAGASLSNAELSRLRELAIVAAGALRRWAADQGQA
jgi:hypothetical protein